MILLSGRSKIFAARSRVQMLVQCLNTSILFSFILVNSLFYKIQKFLLFFILLFLILYLYSNLMLLLFLSIMAILLLFSRSICLLLKIKGNLLINMHLLLINFHQNFELSFDNLYNKTKARFIDQSFHLIKCILKSSRLNLLILK